MNKITLVLAVIGAWAILCQWFVFTSIRTYLFERYGPITRRIAYPVLILLGIINCAAAGLAFNTDWLPPDTYQRKVVTVLYFSYLGLVLAMSLFFLALGLFSRTLNFKDAVAAMIKKRIGRSKCRTMSAPSDVRNSKPTPAAAATSNPSTTGVTGKIREEGYTAEQCTHPEDQPPLRRHPPSPSRRAFLKWSTAAGFVGAFGYAGHGLAQAYQDPVVDEFPLSFPQLSGLRRPLTLIQITDLHFGLFVGSSEMKRLVDQTNSIEGDAVLITGDVFHSRINPVEPAIPLLKKLRPRRLGNFAVLGNHDFYAGEHRSVAAFRDGGLTLLRDQWVTLDHGNQPVHLGGIDDPLGSWLWGREFPGFQAFMEKAPTAPGIRILLSHRPNVLPLASNSDIDLVLSGHTHGGQVILPTCTPKRGLSLARLASPYTHGWYRQGETRMYLNRGVGLTFVPWRINCPPEIAVVHLSGSPISIKPGSCPTASATKKT